MLTQQVWGQSLWMLHVCMLSRFSHVHSLPPYGLQPARLLCPWGPSGKSTGVGRHALLQWIFLTQGWNLPLLYCRQILYRLDTGEAHGGCFKNEQTKHPLGFALQLVCEPRPKSGSLTLYYKLMLLPP